MGHCTFFSLCCEGYCFCFPQDHGLGSPRRSGRASNKKLRPSIGGGVRVGKTITFEMEGEDSPETRTQIDRLCDGLLSNPVIEDYRFEIEAG